MYFKVVTLVNRTVFLLSCCCWFSCSSGIVASPLPLLSPLLSHPLTLLSSSVLFWYFRFVGICSDLFQYFYTILALPIESEIMHRFWCSRCLNDHIEVPDMIGSFESGATPSLVAKNGTKQLSQPFEDGF